MPFKIEREEDGQEIEVYTKEELAAEKSKIEEEFKGKLAEKDEHVKKKLDEFMQGKKSVDDGAAAQAAKEKEWNEKFEQTNKVAQEAMQKAEAEKAARFNSLRDFLFHQYGAVDDESKKKALEAYELVNIPADSDDNVKKRVELAAKMVGLDGSNSAGPVFSGVSFAGGYAPSFEKKKEQATAEDYKKFKSELGFNFNNDNK